MVVSRLLRFVIIADALATAGTGLLMVTLGGALEPLLGIPASLMHYAGLGLLPYAAVVGYLGSRTRVPRWAILAVVVGNVLWTVDSVLLLLTGWVEPTKLGYAFVIGQAVVVGVFAELQYVGLRQSTPAPWDGQTRTAAA